MRSDDLVWRSCHAGATRTPAPKFARLAITAQTMFPEKRRAGNVPWRLRDDREQSPRSVRVANYMNATHRQSRAVDISLNQH